MSRHTPPKFKIASETRCLEDWFLFGNVTFRGFVELLGVKIIHALKTAGLPLKIVFSYPKKEFM